MQTEGRYSSLTRMALKVCEGAKRADIIDSSFIWPVFYKSYFLYKGYIEDLFYNFSRRHPHLIGGGIIFDISANIGHGACTFAEAAAPYGIVSAFEPDAENFTMLVRAVSDRDLRILRTAVCSGVGSIRWKNQKRHGDHRQLQEHTV